MATSGGNNLMTYHQFLAAEQQQQAAEGVQSAREYEQIISLIPNPRSGRGSISSAAFPEHHRSYRKTREPDTLLLLTRTHTDERGRRHSVAIPLLMPPYGEKFEGGYLIERNPITGGSRLICPPKEKGGGRTVRAKAELEETVEQSSSRGQQQGNNNQQSSNKSQQSSNQQQQSKGAKGKDNWSALKGKMFGRSMSVEGGRGKEDVKVLSEFKEAKGGGVAGVKGSKRGEVRGIEKATSSQPSPEPSSISPRKTRRSQRGRGKAKSEKQVPPSSRTLASCPLALPDNFDL